MYLLLGKGSTRIGHHIFYTALVHGDDIGVSLHHIYLVGLDYGLLGLKESVKFATFAIDGRLGRVLILHGHTLGSCIQHSTTKTCHLATNRVPRKHHTSPEAVYHTTILALDGEARAHQVLLLVALSHSTLAHDISSLGTET